VTMVAGLRSIAKAMELPPEPNVRAPALDPTCERLWVKLPGPTRPLSKSLDTVRIIKEGETAARVVSWNRPDRTCEAQVK
jgi:hypothetical protein